MKAKKKKDDQAININANNYNINNNSDYKRINNNIVYENNNIQSENPTLNNVNINADNLMIIEEEEIKRADCIKENKNNLDANNASESK